MKYRKPVAAITLEGGHAAMVVCNDGAVFVTENAVNVGKWFEAEPIPGTKADLARPRSEE